MDGTTPETVMEEDNSDSVSKKIDTLIRMELICYSCISENKI